jgi:hypothetical protein
MESSRIDMWHGMLPVEVARLIVIGFVFFREDARAKLSVLLARLPGLSA